METFKEGVFYRLVDENGFVFNNSVNVGVNSKIVEFINSMGGKFKVKDVDPASRATIIGGDYATYPDSSEYRMLNSNERQYFEEVIDDELPMKIPNVPYVYVEDVTKAIKSVFEDDAFFHAFKLLSASDAAHVLNLKISGLTNANV